MSDIGKWAVVWLLSKRLVRMGLVGLFCFLVQIGIMFGLVQWGWRGVVSNALGFAVSAQLNFSLCTLLVWPGPHLFGVVRRWLSFNTVVLIALAVNSVAFAATEQVSRSLLLASIVALVASFAVSFTANNRITFLSPQPPTPLGE